MRIYLILCLIFVLSIGNSQGKKDILPISKNIIKEALAGNYETVFNHTYPKVFDLVTREQMTQVIKSTLKNDIFEITFNNIDNDIKIDDIKIINEHKYALVSYKNSMSLKFFEEENLDTELMLNIFKAKYPNSQISYNKKNKTFTIDMTSKMLAISDELTHGEWKLLNVNQSDKNMIQLILDKEVINTYEL